MSAVLDKSDLENTSSFLKNDDSVQQQTYDKNGGNNDLASNSIKPFNNNPPLPHTQRY